MLQYKELLQALEHHCDQILASADTTEDAVAQAQQAKDELYLTFSKVSTYFVVACVQSTPNVAVFHILPRPSWNLELDEIQSSFYLFIVL